MEHALWNGEELTAEQVGANYFREKEIRKASGHRQLLCPDPECQARVVKYCHGEIKSPYFAHLEESDCDYERFDRTNSEVMRRLAGMIADILSARGIYVEKEKKVLAHHYAHLLLVREDGCEMVVELGTKSLSANHVDGLMKEYSNAGIDVVWLVVGDPETNLRESGTGFLKRFALNETKNLSLLVVSPKGDKVTGYRRDPSCYEYRGKCYQVPGYEELYKESGELRELVVDDEELTLCGLEEHFQEWLLEKHAAAKRLVDGWEKARLQKREEEDLEMEWRWEMQERRAARRRAEKGNKE